jgi:hypothetical protein
VSLDPVVESRVVGQTLIAVPVPAAEPLIRGIVDKYDAAFPSARPDDLLAHITVLGPFVPIEACNDQLFGKLRTVFSQTKRFDFRLEEVATFPGDVVYLAPEPADAFVELTQVGVEAFPGFPPYGGRFQSVIPHLTVGPIWSVEMERDLIARARNAAPIDAAARCVSLIHNRDDAFETVATFPFAE